jgi:hypothetical protein
VSRAHIDVLVQGLCESERVTDPDPDEVGRILWRENLTSVADRYPDDTDGTRPGPIDFKDRDVEDYTYRRPSVTIDRQGLLVAAGCYDYQSCEHPEWPTSQAFKWISSLVNDLNADGVTWPESGTRPWGYEDDDVHGKDN